MAAELKPSHHRFNSHGGGGTPHPGGLVLQYVCGVLVAEAQQQPHSVSLQQSVQNTEPPMEGVVARISGSGWRSPDPGARRGLQEETPHLLAEPEDDNRRTKQSR